jgi:hypothetical protein
MEDPDAESLPAILSCRVPEGLPDAANPSRLQVLRVGSSPSRKSGCGHDIGYPLFAEETYPRYLQDVGFNPEDVIHVSADAPPDPSGKLRSAMLELRPDSDPRPAFATLGHPNGFDIVVTDYATTPSLYLYGVLPVAKRVPPSDGLFVYLEPTVIFRFPAHIAGLLKVGGTAILSDAAVGPARETVWSYKGRGSAGGILFDHVEANAFDRIQEGPYKVDGRRFALRKFCNFNAFAASDIATSQTAFLVRLGHPERYFSPDDKSGVLVITRTK